MRTEERLANALGRQLSRFASIHIFPTWDGKDRYCAELRDQGLLLHSAIRLREIDALRALNEKLKRALLQRVASDKRFCSKWKLRRSE